MRWGEKRGRNNRRGRTVRWQEKFFTGKEERWAKGEKKPRFRLVAVAGLDMKVYGKHLRKSELEQIAKAVGAKLILLKGGEGKHKRRKK